MKDTMENPWADVVPDHAARPTIPVGEAIYAAWRLLPDVQEPDNAVDAEEYAKVLRLNPAVKAAKVDLIKAALRELFRLRGRTDFYNVARFHWLPNFHDDDATHVALSEMGYYTRSYDPDRAPDGLEAAWTNAPAGFGWQITEVDGMDLTWDGERLVWPEGHIDTSGRFRR